MPAAAAVGPTTKKPWVVGCVIAVIIVHAVYILSVVDIYFTSPVVNGLETQSADLSPPIAKRVVLFSADGLRADRFFEVNQQGKPRAPFLHGIAAKKGRFGVSHTHVPTESRPGHVAMIAGLYEDVSAITRGWRHNPVPFDSVLNQSSRGWAYGSPDIVPMFVEKTPHVTWECYPVELEDFASQSAVLDMWVFDHMISTANKALKNATLAEDMRQPGVMIFLHLLALDTSGHAYRPASTEYLENIRRVDEGVRVVYEKLEELYPDGKTAYIFTSDHGMNAKGAHGDGDPANTQTPLVVWGSGIAGPLPELRPDHTSHLPADQMFGDVVVNFDSPTPLEWGSLAGLRRFDIEQADIAPMLAVLAGVNLPANSVGRAPLDYFATNLKNSAKIVYANAVQLSRILCKKLQDRQQRALWFSPFPAISGCGEENLAEAEKLIENGEYPAAIAQLENLITLILQGCDYFQTYDKPFLLTVCSLGYLGAMAFCITFVLRFYTTPHIASGDKKEGQTIRHLFTLLSIGVMGQLIIQQAPVMHYVYCSLLLVLWRYVLTAPEMIAALRHVKSPAFIKTAVITALAVQALVLAFHKREAFVIAFIAIALWPMLGGAAKLGTVSAWAAACIAVGCFTLLPTHAGDLPLLVVLGGVFVIVVGIAVETTRLGRAVSIDGVPVESGGNKWLLWVQVACVAVSLGSVFESSRRLHNRERLPQELQILNWVLGFGSLPFAIFSSPAPLRRMASVVLAVAPLYILLSVAYEMVFFCALAVLLLVWPVIEKELHQRQADTAVNVVSVSDCRFAVTFIYLVFVSFFGTGNVASISSFEASSTYRFLTLFSPFLMGGLLVLKILVPFLLLGAALRLLLGVLQKPPFGVFLLIAALSEILCINFLFLVKNEGSWKDIGMSISHHIIVNCFLIVVIVSFALSAGYTRGISAPTARRKD